MTHGAGSSRRPATGDATLRKLNPCTYRGYSYDAETGLYYLQSRYYNPEWGRFINADVAEVLNLTQDKAIGANLFAYCSNSPVMSQDPTGFFAASLLMSLGVSAGVAIATVAVLQKVMAAAIGILAGVLIAQVLTHYKGSISSALIRMKRQVLSQMQSLRRILLNSAKKALQKFGFNKLAIHHIVAKAAWRAAPARNVLKNAKISVNSSHNLVPLKAGFHMFLHTNLYYNTINKLIQGAVKGLSKNNGNYYRNTYLMLTAIKKTLQTINSAINI